METQETLTPEEISKREIKLEGSLIFDTPPEPKQEEPAKEKTESFTISTT